MVEEDQKLDEFESRYPKLGREVIQTILSCWNQERGVYESPSYEHHFGEQGVTVGDISDAFNLRAFLR